jgi:hypothetical protein
MEERVQSGHLQKLGARIKNKMPWGRNLLVLIQKENLNVHI